MHGSVSELDERPRARCRLARLAVLFGAAMAALLLLVVTIAATVAASPVAASPVSANASSPLTSTFTLNCRLGYAALGDALRNYPINLLGGLNAGHYLNFTVYGSPPQPTGLEYIEVVRVHQLKTCAQYNCPYVVPYTYTVSPDRAIIAQIAQARPGTLWFIGNEIDRRDVPGAGGQTFGQDEMLPELYAVLYHELHALLKSADPTSRVANAGVIQATPLRLQYLDRVWNEYLRLYGEPMPVDQWNVHNFVFRERAYYPGCPDCWGADVPPGFDVPYGMLYEAEDTVSMTLFSNQLIAFRQWMASKGQRDKPLIVSEYGTFPLDYYDPGVGINYLLTGTFQYLRTATDAQLGYPGDENRLAQRWVVYSLDDASTYGGAHLIDPTSMQLTEFGEAWTNYVNDPARGFVPLMPNLRPGGVRTDPAVLVSLDGLPITVTLYPQASNSGNISTTRAFDLRVTDSQWPLGGLSQFGALDGCGRRVDGSGVLLRDMLPGVHTVTLQVDSHNAVAEIDESDNVTQVHLLVATRRLFMPLVSWNARVVGP